MINDDKSRNENPLSLLEHFQEGSILCNYPANTKEQLNNEKGGYHQTLQFAEDKRIMEEIRKITVTLDNTYELIYRIVHRSGKIRGGIDKVVKTKLSDGRLRHKSILYEITGTKKLMECTTLLSQTGRITGLNNKHPFTLLTENTLNYHGENCYALMMLDIDSFKSINENSGYVFGDNVLEVLAQELKSFFTNKDILGRVKGDEFMVLMSDVSYIETLKKKAKSLCTTMRTINISGDKQCSITISGGISLFIDGKDLEKMFIEANTALYQAKSLGKNQFYILQEQEETIKSGGLC